MEVPPDIGSCESAACAAPFVATNVDPSTAGMEYQGMRISLMNMLFIVVFVRLASALEAVDRRTVWIVVAVFAAG